jgi:DNA mismatch repair protein MutS2
MRFDSELRPTYRLEVGPPGRSLALAAAGRIGFPQRVLLRAEELIDPNTREVGAILAQLEALLNQADQSAQATAAELKNLQAEREVLQARLAQIESEREQIVTAAREEADLELARLQEQVKNLRAQAKSGQKSEALRTIEQLRRDYRPKTRSLGLEVEPGQEVFVTSYGKKAWVLERRGEQAVVQLGAIRATVPLIEIKPVAATAVDRPARGGVTTSRESWELDLRGFTAEEAVLAVHDFLSEAVAGGAGAARIVHGKGSGVLREVIRRELARDKRVSSFHDAMPYQGGHGVTEVEL